MQQPPIMHVSKGGLLLVTFLQCFACLACVGMVSAKSVGPTTIVECNTFTMHFGSVAKASVVGACVVGLRCLDGGHMVSSMESSLLHSELPVMFDILFIEVYDEMFNGVFSDRALAPITTSLHIQSGVVEDLQCSAKHSIVRNGFASTGHKCLNF